MPKRNQVLNILGKYMITLTFGILILLYMIKMTKKHLEFMLDVVNVELVAINVLVSHVKRLDLLFMIEMVKRYVN